MDKNNFKTENFQTERSLTHSFGFWFVIFLILIVLEQLTKFIAEQHTAIFLNNQFAFSLPLPVPLMYIVYSSVLILSGRYIFRSWNQLTAAAKLGWCLILSGGVSNIAERIFVGHVRDFIYIANGILNVADFFIIIGLVIVVTQSTKKTLS